VDEDYDQAELDRVSRYLNESFQGLSLREIRARLLEMMSEEKAQYDCLMREALELSARTFDPIGVQSDLIVEGKTNILDAQAFDNVERMKSLFHAFEEKSRLVALLNGCLEEKGHRLFIGSEAGTAGIEGCSLIVSPYHDGTTPMGTVGVLGPARMEYARVISVVDTLARLLSELLTEGQTTDRRSPQGGPR
jgi:heat-inducible transcriptional repressor